MPWIHELRALADDSGKQLTFVDRTGTPMEFVNLAEPNEPFTRRLAACWNVCMGIPTEGLEAGQMVPLSLVDSIVREVLTNSEKYVPAAMLGTQGLNAYHGIMREIEDALSRIEQKGGVGR